MLLDESEKLTKRELFALFAMQGILVNSGSSGMDVDAVTDLAIDQADDLLDMLKQKKE